MLNDKRTTKPIKRKFIFILTNNRKNRIHIHAYTRLLMKMLKLQQASAEISHKNIRTHANYI